MSVQGVKRKKKTFFQKSKKYYKKGIRGRGTHIDEENFEYFLHILKVMNQKFDAEDDRQAFIENVFEQVQGKEVEYSCNQVVSRIIDNLLPGATNETVLKFMESFTENIRPICMDPYGSFVLQKLMYTVTERYTGDDNEFKSLYGEWLTKTFKFVLNNVDEFVFDNYANHIMRTVIKCLVGQTCSTEKNTKVNSEQTSKEEVTQLNVKHEEFTPTLKSFVDNFLEWTRFSELPYETLSSGFVQVLVQCVAIVNPKRTKLLCRKLLDVCLAPHNASGSEFPVDEKEKKMEQQIEIPELFSYEPCIRLLETILTVAPPKIYTQIYAKCFINRLGTLAQHKEANFAVQKLIRCCKEKVEFESIFDELSISFEDILNEGKTGVILSLCEGCLRFKTKQSVFMQNWMNYLQCNEPKENQSLIAVLTIYMKKRGELNETQEKNVNLHGSLLVQNMLKFNKPIKVVNSLLEANKEDLVFILCSPKGSHIADAFFQSEFVGEKSREKCVKVLQGSYTSLATSKHGSRVFDTIWRTSSIKNRLMIASELLENTSKLESNQFGAPIAYNISLASLRHSKEDWIKAHTQGDKVKKLFADLVK